MSKTFIIQHAESGDYDYSEYASTEAAWDVERGEDWVQTAMEEGDKTMEECREEFVDSLSEYTEEEVLDAVFDGYDWPEKLGIVYKLSAPATPVKSWDYRDTVRAFPSAMLPAQRSRDWLGEDGSTMEDGITLWRSSSDKRLLVVEVTDSGTGDDVQSCFVFVDDHVIESWSEYSVDYKEELKAAEDRAREFADGYRD